MSRTTDFILSEIEGGGMVRHNASRPAVRKATMLIRLENGTTINATQQYSSGDNITVKGSNGYIYEIDANIHDDGGAYIVVG